MKRTFDVVEWKEGNHPPKEGEYLVTVDRGWVDILYYYAGYKVWRRYSYTTEDFTEAIPNGVIAWAELPEAYTADCVGIIKGIQAGYRTEEEGESNE